MRLVKTNVILYARCIKKTLHRDCRIEVKSKSEWLLKCLAASVSGYEKKKSSESSEKMEKEYNKSLYYTAGM